MNKNSKLWIVLKGIIVENPVLVLVLGTCPALAVSTSIVSAISMGLAATIVLICSNVFISLLRKIIPDTVRIPCYIVVIAGFVTIIQMLLQAFLPDIYTLLGTWLALIVVNCVILGRAEMYARKHNPLDSALDGLGMGIGFLVYGILIAIVNKIGPKAGSEKRKNFSCAGCPSASICGRVSCSENAELVSAAEESTLSGDNA